MKVALFVSSEQIPQIGGGYTFESQLLNAISRLSSNSKHTFIYYSKKGIVATEQSELMSQVASSDIFLGEESKLQLLRMIKTILSKLGLQTIIVLAKQWWQEKYLLKSLKNNQIDITLSLVPSNCPPLEYPCILPVWDLQHRLQPYFPEVSRSGEWESREKYYEKALRRATLIITGTEVGKAEIESFYQVPKDRIKVIPFFTPQLLINIDPTNNIFVKYNIPEKYLFYPAQFWPHKNHIGLLLAIKYLKEKHDLEFPLVLVGSDQGNEAYVKEMVKELDLSNQVHFLGFVPNGDMPYLYQNAFALSFTSFFGPDNLPPLEAMSFGCPVIAAAASGAKEQLGDAALLVDPKQPEEIANAIKSLYEDSILRQRLIDSGLIRANQWTVNDYVKELMTSIDDIEAIRRTWK
jgi:glycosyltransferase involved in cell wall biosynthesis